MATIKLLYIQIFPYLQEQIKNLPSNMRKIVNKSVIYSYSLHFLISSALLLIVKLIKIKVKPTTILNVHKFL